ncbi:MAG: hypothetical protein A2583_02315 [Bdellovibrionales bacterium RIFOXYD1_FULL_53_11]|nr:MAG: hypothetical protein A2583_02315 [Bdellovibrionales bacterium RIFOXYD1_FULL_53_11]
MTSDQAQTLRELMQERREDGGCQENGAAGQELPSSECEKSGKLEVDTAGIWKALLDGVKNEP